MAFFLPLYPMYEVSDYGEMIADKVRMDAYAYALKRAITPDSIVLDIGAATGIHALLACKFGAKKVYAVESNDAIHLARELAQANGFANRIQFFHDLSTNITLPEPADVIVSDLRGQLPLYGQHIPSIIDARTRHLAPGGVMIPRQDTISAALVEAGSVYNELIKPWDLPYGLTMDAARRQVLNSWSIDDTDVFRPHNLLMEAQVWAILDYTSIQKTDVTPLPIVQKANRDGMAHGVLIWFDAELADGIGFSNAPHSEKVADVYGRGFFPLLDPVPITKGDTITLHIQAELADDDYVWRWHTCINNQDNPDVVIVDFKQSTHK
ncbi:MAG: methyltransferase domain-containing protein [Chloroflexi bacterium]|nr:methyltransferase domain-containing protein [Chloroflexota bacterium]